MAERRRVEVIKEDRLENTKMAKEVTVRHD